MQDHSGTKPLHGIDLDRGRCHGHHYFCLGVQPLCSKRDSLRMIARRSRDDP